MVFLYVDYIFIIRCIVCIIWGKWLCEFGYEVVYVFDFELYDEWFDGMMGNGGVEIWILIKNWDLVGFYKVFWFICCGIFFIYVVYCFICLKFFFLDGGEIGYIGGCMFVVY